MIVYGLFYQANPECQMIASSAESAKVMRAMFGPGSWSTRLLTDEETQDPWVQREVKAMQDAGVWS